MKSTTDLVFNYTYCEVFRKIMNPYYLSESRCERVLTRLRKKYGVEVWFSNFGLDIYKNIEDGRMIHVQYFTNTVVYACISEPTYKTVHQTKLSGKYYKMAHEIIGIVHRECKLKPSLVCRILNLIKRIHG